VRYQGHRIGLSPVGALNDVFALPLPLRGAGEGVTHEHGHADGGGEGPGGSGVDWSIVFSDPIEKLTDGAPMFIFFTKTT
jgi:hypothetical protein